MRKPGEAVRTSAFISATTISMAVLALVILKPLMIPSEHAFDAFAPSLAFGAAACLTGFARRHGQAQLALGLYLLTLGGALAFFLWTVGFGGDDFDALPLLISPWYLLVGSVLLAVSLFARRHWMTSVRTTAVRTILLAGPGSFLLILLLLVLGSGEWRTSPFGLDLLVASWITGAGIFFAGSKWLTNDIPGPHHVAMFRSQKGE